jgi:hypothetical protein
MKDKLKRYFTVMAMKKTKTLFMSIKDLNRMKREFLKSYDKLFSKGYV